MKPIDRPSGYFQTFDPASGRVIEGETRTCVHCGFMWIYNPKDSFDRKLAGKTVQRGTCMKCYGSVCARKHCLAQGCKPFIKKIEEVEEAERRRAQREADMPKSPGGILLGG